MSVAEIRQAAKALAVSGPRDFEIKGISTDSRTVKPGDLFVPLVGEHFDGHDFLAKALDAGACGALYSNDSSLPGVRSDKVFIKVADTLTALGDVARKYREGLTATVVAITGSNGKTTTKDMTKYLLEEKMPVAASPSSYNNAVGVPLTLFRARAATKVVVLELGANHPGELARLGEIAAPDVVAVTNVGRTHLEGFGSVEGVAAEKASLLHCLKSNGVAVLNADDARVIAMRNIVAGKVLTFGVEKSADIFASRVRRTNSGFSLTINDSMRAALNVSGAHNVSNALAAISICRRLGLPLEYLAERLGDFRLSPMRLEVQEKRGATVVNDAYNANPESMASGIEEFARRKAKRKFFVFADMLELGEDGADLHREIGAKAAEEDFDFYWATGDLTRYALDAILAAGVPAGRVRRFETVEKLGRALRKELKNGDAAFLKGSRAMGLERVLRLIG